MRVEIHLCATDRAGQPFQAVRWMPQRQLVREVLGLVVGEGHAARLTLAATRSLICCHTSCSGVMASFERPAKCRPENRSGAWSGAARPQMRMRHGTGLRV